MPVRGKAAVEIRGKKAEDIQKLVANLKRHKITVAKMEEDLKVAKKRRDGCELRLYEYVDDEGHEGVKLPSGASATLVEKTHTGCPKAHLEDLKTFMKDLDENRRDELKEVAEAIGLSPGFHKDCVRDELNKSLLNKVVKACRIKGIKLPAWITHWDKKSVTIRG